MEPYLKFDTVKLTTKRPLRTFGLDRIENLCITEKKFIRSEQLAATTQKFEQVYGLVYEPYFKTSAKQAEQPFRQELAFFQFRS